MDECAAGCSSINVSKNRKKERKKARKQGYIYVLNSPVIRSEAMFQKQMLFSTIWCPKLH